MFSLANSLKRLFVAGAAANMAYVLLFSRFEHRSFGDSFWWCWVTVFTVGYGDISPVSAPGRGVAIVSMATNCLLMVLLAAHFVVVMVKEKNIYDEEEQERDRLRDERAEHMAVERAASLRRLEEHFGTLPKNAPPLPVFRTNEELLDDVRRARG